MDLSDVINEKLTGDLKIVEDKWQEILNKERNILEQKCHEMKGYHEEKIFEILENMETVCNFLYLKIFIF